MRTWKFFVLTAIAAAFCVPATASAAFMHVVAPGESLASVAATDGLSVNQLAAANGLSPNSQLIAGSSIAIPPQTGGISGSLVAGSPATASVTETAAPVSTSGGGYTVQPGDTLSSIAARYGVTVDQLAAANGLSPSGLLVSGTTLSVSGAPSSAAPTSEEAVETSPGTTQEVSNTVPSSSAVGTAAPSSSGSSTGAQPTTEYVSPSQVGSIAAANGVPPSLAEAIGYQESGFNNSEVSTTGAVGVMQIEPGTWNYIGQNLAGPPPLSPASAADNVRAGSLLLHSLLNQTGGNQAMAAAAYYQGLPSIQAHGVLPATQQYVNDVMALQQRFGGG
ncbi:MAG TPA: LysM peptidoglycan-binding domain-containing protein [Solirubrobacteraceae bacterium]|nr:LysM peptidoglycan-binding domain-containing protein [Solirubrobacteraceae bacterium]